MLSNIDLWLYVYVYVYVYIYVTILLSPDHLLMQNSFISEIKKSNAIV